MDALVLRVALVVLAVSVPAWLVLSTVVVVGRARYDRKRRRVGKELGERRVARLVRRASGRPRTEWGKWRRVEALQLLAQARHPRLPVLIRPVLADPDARIQTAAIRTLGDVGDEWAVDQLVSALREGVGARSRVAAELERLVPLAGQKLVPLLRDWNPAVRFWAATLLEPYPQIATANLVTLTWDGDPNVRAAAVETLGSRSGAEVGTAIVARLDDSEWFVRVHAARAAAHVVGAEVAPTVARLLADEKWWVRTAAKDALRSMGVDAVPSLLSVLGHEDEFARNGAAEVLQDIGFVDFLALDDPGSPLLERIYAAGGERLRDAAEARVEDLPPVAKEVRAA